LCSDEFYMRRVLKLAEGGWGRTNPNPLVGALIVRDGKIIAEGFHEVLGCAHAEISALNNAEVDVTGGVLFVNLEPCSHYGRTPPCAKAIIEAGIKEVVVAMVDPNPKVSGRGIQMLIEAGINVKVGVLEEEAKKLNEIFISYITKKKPFVIMKSAMTLDGKIASVKGDSKWISGEESRKQVHNIRNRVAAIMVGINTVISDNPSLTTRLENENSRNPIRIILDSKGRIPEDSKVLNADKNTAVILATTETLNIEKEKRLSDRGIKIIKTESTGNRVDLEKLMEILYQLEIDSILLEGGGTLNASALKFDIVDKVMCFIAPKIIGGKDAITPVEGDGIEVMDKAIQLRDVSCKMIGKDILIEGYI
jgi:diaminohydroxyphosphoribosylaminopyrimidine deaminase / 5-amino-6-(5-phosphoribosylamino)uracil reductase